MYWLYEAWIRWLGVRFRLHPLFTIVLLLSAVTGHFLEIITLFGLVLIHELGHAAAAKQLGWRVREVQLTPFGGVAVTDEDGSMPAREEAVVAIAGPAMNALMIGFGYAMWGAGVWTHAWMIYFVQANATLMLFNMLPVLPLDGGKLLRVSIGSWLPYYKTLKATSMWSMIASGLLVGVALTQLGEGGLGMNILFIGSFLLYANWYEWKSVPYRFFRFLLVRGRRVGEWLRRGATPMPIVVRRRAPVSDVVRRLMRERLHLVVVLNEEGDVLALLPEDRCTKHYLEREQHRAVSELFM
ncbi:M50 family metallopeptidase [Paenibacillus sp. TRM 82003]|nr:M50 family metallopeptidase [Paenibacillus sp. TRM 82003]